MKKIKKHLRKLKERLGDIFKNKKIKEKIKDFFQKLYNIVSVISTCAIFLGLLYFVIGKITGNNQSDNDLIMKQIKDEMSEGEVIINIENEDIHGFGNNSIIITTSNAGKAKWEDKGKNKLIIMESVENEILDNMNDLFGLKSNYKTTFSYSILCENSKLIPEINCVTDVVGDSTKELIVNYYVWGSTYGAYYTAIFKYSYENEKFEIIGSYPIVEKMEISQYSKTGEIVFTKCEMIYTKFDETHYESKDVYKFNDGVKSYNLTHYSWYCRDYWVDFGNNQSGLVIVKEDKYNQEKYINCYQPSYDGIEKKLNWNLVYSEYANDLPSEYTKGDLARYLTQKFECDVMIIN